MSSTLSEIKRYPVINNDPLQGWDAADILLLNHAHLMDLSGKSILILNDQFGALSSGLQDFTITTYTDSYVSSMGIRLNTQERVIPIHNLSDLTGVYDLVLIQLPKNMSFFEDILCHLTHHLNENSKIVIGGMVKHMAPTSFDLIQKYIGPTTTSLAQKKARLIFTEFKKMKIDSHYPVEINIDHFDFSFTNHSNLFSREKLDIGTRFFLEHIPKGDFQNILDLGCANGIIGIKAKLLNPDASIHFSDESFMAIVSAKTNYQKFCEDEAKFHWTNCFEERTKNAFDLVLCNPPFHQKNTIGDFIAVQMFKDSFESLNKGGKIRVIGNSHLGYHIKLKNIFGNSKIIATNQKFMIIESIR